MIKPAAMSTVRSFPVVRGRARSLARDVRHVVRWRTPWETENVSARDDHESPADPEESPITPTVGQQERAARRLFRPSDGNVNISLPPVSQRFSVGFRFVVLDPEGHEDRLRITAIKAAHPGHRARTVKMPKPT